MRVFSKISYKIIVLVCILVGIYILKNYKGAASIDINQIDTKNFDSMSVEFDGHWEDLLTASTMAFQKINYEVFKIEKNPKNKTGSILARYRQTPQQNYPPIVVLTVDKKGKYNLWLKYQADKIYMPKHEGRLTGPFANELYRLIRNGQYNIKEVIQESYEPLYQRLNPTTINKIKD